MTIVKSQFNQQIRLNASLLMILCILSLTFISCSDEIIDGQLQSKGEVTFQVESVQDFSHAVSNDNKTRGGIRMFSSAGDRELFLSESVVNGINSGLLDNIDITRSLPVNLSNFYDRLGIFGFEYSTWDESRVTANIAKNESVSPSNGSITTKYYLPASPNKEKFFLYGPYGGKGISFGSGTGAPVMNYSVPDNVVDQKDLVVATSSELDHSGGNELLNFKHVLTAVKFKVGSNMWSGRITKISIDGVYSKGNYSFLNGSWSNLGTTKNFSQTLNFNTDGTKEVEITGDDKTFMMLPQTLPAGSKVTVTFTDALTSTQRTMTADISGTKWEQGTTVTYAISTTSLTKSDYVFTVSQPSAFTYAGGTNTFKVQSYVTVKRNGDKDANGPIPWTTEYYVNGNWTTKAPDWVQMPSRAAGSVAGDSYNMRLSIQNVSARNSAHVTNLQSKTAKGSSDSPYDLSTHTYSGSSMSMTTANCYVVNGPGVYRIPLVYGNAIKNGSTNSAAYTASQEALNYANSGREYASRIMKVFTNHLGNPISDPYIYKNTGCVPAKTDIVWQDAFNLLTNIHLSEDKHYIVFTVEKETICPGNSLIAVKDASGTIMWSWLIWVTDTDLSKHIAITNAAGNIHNFMNSTLGWCDPETRTYEDRSIRIRLTQAESGKTSEFIVSQTGSTVQYGGNNVLFQKGRKDPMPGGNGIVQETKALYNVTDSFETKFGTYDGVEKDMIKHPNVMYTHYLEGYEDLDVDARGGGNAYYNPYLNYWDTNLYFAGAEDTYIDGHKQIKTVYDPCPYGFVVPQAIYFSGFINDDSSNRINAQGGFTGYKQGYYFYTKPNGQGDTVFLPALGWRYSGSGLFTEYNATGVFWTTEFEETETSGAFLRFTSKAIEITYGGGTGAALTIFPAVEE